MSKKFDTDRHSFKIEKWVGKMLEKFDSTGIEWSLFVNPYDDAQYKMYEPPKKTSYPDWEGYGKKKELVLLVEVKSHMGYFDGRNMEIAMPTKYIYYYKKVSEKEKVPVRVVFVIYFRDKNKYELYWENIFNIGKMNYYVEDYEWQYKNKKEVQETAFFDVSYFRTDIKNLGNI